MKISKHLPTMHILFIFIITLVVLASDGWRPFPMVQPRAFLVKDKDGRLPRGLFLAAQSFCISLCGGSTLKADLGGHLVSRSDQGIT